ncbi:hypothetical protein [Rickettsiella endosymbiont of Miltochrista miniata]|uniref:hypothetical protein n=1 Tax=Rickettsiella endosymbiont of Miltochrista miniata TaxID=3066239 RepID=UPI00313DF440
MPLTTPQPKNAQNYDAIKKGLYNLNKFISANGSDDLFSLFTENKKTEIDNLFFIPPRQSKPGTSQKGKVIDLLTITNGWFQDPKTDEKTKEIREKVFSLFSFDRIKMMALRKQLEKESQTSEQKIISQLETFETKIDALTPEQTFQYINLYIFVRWDNIVSLFRLQEIQKSLNAKKFIPLGPENYELLKNKPEPNQTLSFSQLGNIKDWPKVKQGILNNLVPPQTDTLSSISTPSSSNTMLNTSINDSINISPDSTDTSGSITPSIDTQLVINEQAQNQEIVQLKHTKKELEEKSQSLEAIKANLETQISELQILLQTNEAVQQQESESNKQKLENLQTTLAFFQKNTKDKEVELESLKKLKEDYLLSLQNAKSDLQKTQQEKNDLTTKLKETEVKIKTLEANNTKLADAVEKTNTQLTETANNLELKSSAHDLVSKQLNDLQTQHAFLRDTLGNHNKLLQEDLQSKETNTQLLHAEINKLNDEISLKVRELNDAIQKFDESKKTIDALKLNKIELEKQKNSLNTQKNEIQTQLSKQKDTHQALEMNHKLFIAESTIKDRDLEKQKNVIVKVERQLKAQIEQSGQLKEEIREKDKQIEEQRQTVTKINDTLQAKEKEFQQITGQLETVKHQLQEANVGEKTAREQLAANDLKRQELEPLKEKISQAKESFTSLTAKLHLEENKTKELNGELTAFNEQAFLFIQTMQTELDKLNSNETQTHKKLDSIDTKYKINPIDTIIPLDEDVTDISIFSYNDQTIEKLDFLKQQLISTLYNLKSQDEQKKRLLEIHKQEIDALRNQYKDLETGNTLINENTKKVTAEKKVLEERISSLTNQLIQLEDQNKELYQATTPANYSLEDNWDYDDNEETVDDYVTTAYQEELKSIRASLKETKAELEQKNGELKRLQEKLFTQTEESKLETTKLEDELIKLRTNNSSNQEAISGLTNELTQLKQLVLDKEKTIDELTKKIVINSNLIEKQENQIASLNKTSMEIQEKSKQLENRNRQLEQQTIKHQQDIGQLTNDKFALSNQIGSLTSEKESLCQDLHIAQEKQKESEETISSLQIELDNLQTSKSTNKDKISELTKRIEELSQLKSIQEIQIQELKELNSAQNALEESKFEMTELQDELKEKNENIANLEEEKQQHAQRLTFLDKDLESLNEELQTTKENLKEIETELVRVNESLTQSKKSEEELSDDNKNLKNEYKNIQKIDSDLQIKYGTLEEDLKLKNKEIRVLTDRIAEIQQQLENSKQESENLKTQITTAKQNTLSLEKQLQELKDKENPMPIQDIPTDESLLIDLNSNKDTNTGKISPQLHSSPGSSIASSIDHTPGSSSEPLNFLANLNSSSGEDSGLADLTSSSLNHSSSILFRSQSLPNLRKDFVAEQNAAFIQNNSTNRDLIDLTTDPLEGPSRTPITITPIDGGMPMALTQEQQINNLLVDSEFKNQLGCTLAAWLQNDYQTTVITELNKPEYRAIDSALLISSESEAIKLKLLVRDTVDRLLNDEDTKAEIKEALTQIVSQPEEEVVVLSPENAAKNFLRLFMPNTLSSAPIDYAESNEVLLQTLNVNKVNAQRYVALLKVCGEHILSTENKELAKQYIITKLKEGLTAINVNPEEYREPILNTASRLVDEILNPRNMLDALEKEKASSSQGSNNLVRATKDILSNQCDEKIKSIIETNFAHIFIARILEKINNGQALSEEEIQKIPSELQYADTPEDFALGLTANYHHLKSFPISKDVFDKSVLILRKNALSTINQTLINNDELVDLSAEAWLEKKLALVTDKSIALELNKKQQKDLDNKFYKLFPLSPLEPMAVTHKTVEELTNELEKLHDLKIKAAARLYKTFSEIEIKLKEYPNLIDEKDAEIFKANLNNSLPLIFSIRDVNGRPNVNDAQINIILEKINYRLENDSSKWNWLNNKLTEEITNDILADNANQFGVANKDAIQMLVSNTFEILRKFHDLQDTLNKREKWKTDIKSLYAFTEKLRPNSQFSEEIEKREDILEDILALKQADAEEQTFVIPKGVYIPNKCRIIPNFQSDPSDTYQFDVQANIFYKQKALAPNETVTFAQKLENEKICKWSATHSADKCLTYKIEKKFFRRKKSYMQEISFAQMIHSVNSFKNAKTCTLNFGNCSDAMKEKLYLFAHAYNELRRDNGPQKGPRIMCHMKNPPDMDKDKIAKAKEEIKTKLNLHGEELADTSEKLKDDTISHKIIRSRG